jgi:hypothetical protein
MALVGGSKTFSVSGSNMFLRINIYICGPGSSVGIATDYGLDGPGIEKKIPLGRDFLYTSMPALGPTQPSVQRVPGLSRG